jgi:Ion transport protein
MLSMLTTQQSVCVTGNLLGKLRDVVDNPSTAVMDLMNNCFRVTDQFDGPRPLDWGGDKEELFLDVPTAFLTDKTLQNLVNKAFNTSQPENEPEEIDTSAKQADANNYIQARYDPKTVEALAVLDEAENNKKQVEAKLLDFDWIFTENNAGAMIKCLAETSNDEIFACQQIRILIEFMWQYYYSAIKRSIFYPYVAYFIAFQLYATKLAAHVGDAVDAGYYAEKIALGVFALGWIRFLFLELTQFSVNPSGYIFSFWNILDLTSLAACAAFVFFEYSQMISETNNNILGAGAVLLLWVKLFNWLRIFKSFSAFIRMVSEIVKDIRVFSVMLVLCLTAFANCIIVLNNNRKLTGQDSIFTSYVGWGPADALIHAYLTGLGDNNYDTYSSDDAIAVWILFLGATIIVQLIFMNMLIALMGESFGRISGILEQSTMKELCVMMDDHIWLLNIAELFKGSRYILWLTPGGSQASGSIVERQVA